MREITETELHNDTKSVLDRLAQGETVMLTRNGKLFARMEPLSSVPDDATPTATWDEIMAEVWEAQKRVKPSERTPNPILEDRKRRRR